MQTVRVTCGTRLHHSRMTLASGTLALPMTKVTQHDRYMSDGSSFFASMGKWTFGRGRLDVKQNFFSASRNRAKVLNVKN